MTKEVEKTEREKNKLFMQTVGHANFINLAEIPEEAVFLNWQEAGATPLNLEPQQSYMGILTEKELNNLKFGEALVCHFKSPKSNETRFIVCNDQLKECMDLVNVGDLCVVWCTGRNTSQKTGKEYNTYRLQYCKPV
jgi:hypothetical protein